MKSILKKMLISILIIMFLLNYFVLLINSIALNSTNSLDDNSNFGDSTETDITYDLNKNYPSSNEEDALQVENLSDENNSLKILKALATTEDKVNVSTKTFLGTDELSATDTVYEGQIINNEITIYNGTDSDVNNVKVTVNQTNAVIYDLVEVEVTNPAMGKYEPYMEHQYSAWETDEKAFDTIETLKAGETRTLNYQVLINEVDDDYQVTYGDIKIEADNIDAITLKTQENKIKQGKIKIIQKIDGFEETEFYEESTIQTSLKTTNISGEDLTDIMVTIKLSHNLTYEINEDIDSIILYDSDYNELSSDLYSDLKYDDENKELTFKLLKLEKGQSIVITFFPFLKCTDQNSSTENAKISSVVKIGDETYKSNMVNRDYKHIIKNLALEYEIDPVKDIYENGDRLTYKFKVTNNDSAETAILLQDEFDEAFIINSVKKIKDDSESDITDNVDDNYLAIGNEILKSGETAEFGVNVTISSDYEEDIDVNNTVSLISSDYFEDEKSATIKVKAAKLDDDVDDSDDNKNDNENNDSNNTAKDDENNNSNGSNDEKNNSQDNDDNGDNAEENEINNNGSSNNLVTENKFDFKLDKTITKLSISNGNGTKQYMYDNSKLAKAEIKSKYYNGSQVIVEYEINVTNEGNVTGIVQDVVDYIPEGFKFASNLNKEWYIGSDKNLHNTSLKNVEIEPKESKTLKLILSKTLTNNDVGTFKNIAEISKIKSTGNLQDVDSIVRNKVEGEDDMSEAKVIVSISTGVGKICFISVLLSIILLVILFCILKKKEG